MLVANQEFLHRIFQRHKTTFLRFPETAAHCHGDKGTSSGDFNVGRPPVIGTCWSSIGVQSTKDEVWPCSHQMSFAKTNYCRWPGVGQRARSPAAAVGVAETPKLNVWPVIVAQHHQLLGTVQWFPFSTSQTNLIPHFVGPAIEVGSFNAVALYGVGNFAANRTRDVSTVYGLLIKSTAKSSSAAYS